MYNFAGNVDLKDLAGRVDGTWIDMNSGAFSIILDKITAILTGTYVIEYTTPTKTANESKNISISVVKPPCEGIADITSPPANPSQKSGGSEIQKVGRFFYAGNGKGDTLNDTFYPGYNVTVTKDLQPPTGSGCQDIVLTVTTPSIPCNKRVVFALDDTGSTLQSGIGNLMMNAIGGVLNSYQDVKYARVDWHDASNFDYASSQFNPASYWPQEMSNYPLRPREEYGTACAGGLQKAVSLLKAEQAIASTFDKKTTAWMIVFITGASEYSRSQLAPIIAEANQANISIFALGVGVYSKEPTQLEYDDLVSISTSSGHFYAINPSNVDAEISNSVNEILQGSCNNISTQSVAKNVILTDSIYPYLNVTGTSMLPTSTPPNSDGVTTLVWNLGDMPQATTKTIIINTELEFNKLPIDVTNKRTAVSFSPATATPTSLMTYTAMTDQPRTVALPEGELSVFCGAPPSSLMANIVAPLVSHAQVANNTSE